MTVRAPAPIALRASDLQRPDGSEILVRDLRRFSEETNQGFRGIPPLGVLVVNFVAPSSPTPNAEPFPMTLSLPFGGRCEHIGPGSGRIVAPLGIFIETAIIPDWVNGDLGKVVIRNLTGLVADATYELTFLVVGAM